MSPRAIFASFDSMNEERARTTVDPAAIPAFLRLFADASCTDGARTMWPSNTAPSHAALWTGVYGNVNGVVSNEQVPLPWSEFSLVEQQSGFDARQLGAEPIWITAARAGLSAVAHNVTHVGEPGRWLPGGGRDTAAVRRDSSAIASPRLLMLNGYSGATAALLLDARRRPVRRATAWQHTGLLDSVGVALMETSWAVGRDSLHALFFGRDGYREMVVSQHRDVARGVRVRPAPVERASFEGRELARHFSSVLWLRAPEGRMGFYFRLWDLTPDLSSWQLFQSAGSVMRTNWPDQRAVYEDSAGAFVENPGQVVLREAGPTLAQGGDGSTELKFLETAELQTRQIMRGSAWLWRTRRPDLQTEYFSLADGLDHQWLGAVSSAVPGHDPALAARINAMRSRGWALVDRRLAGLLELAREAGALLVVAGDHGMRPTWKFFHVNTALKDAGLLGTDPQGRPDPRSSRALSSNGYYVNVNRIGRKGGIVPADQVGAVADSVARVLRSARSPDGTPIVTATWRPLPDDTLGIGGPAGGDVYFSLAPGYANSFVLRDSITTSKVPGGSHGFPSIERDMRTVLCATGPGIGGRRLPTARTIDAAPTVSAWLGIPAPLDARGVSLLGRMRTP